MKNLMFLLCTISIILFIGCSEDTITNNHKKIPVSPIDPQTSSNPIISDVVDNYDMNDLVGVIFIDNYYVDIYNSSSHVQGTRNDAIGFIVDNNRTSSLDIGANLIVNGSALAIDYSGNYLLVADESSFDAYFGTGQNKFYIEQTDTFPGILDSITFSSPIQITNISYNQNISKSQNLTVNWSGGKSNELVQLLIFRTDTAIVNAKSGTYKSVTSGSSITVSSSQLAAHLENNGQYSILLTTYDPHYFTLSNNKKFCVIGRSRFEITVNIVN